MNDVTLLVFTLGDARFGLAAMLIREVVRAVAIAPLPKAPAIAEGVINYRGTIVPVLDIRQRFRLAPAPLHPDQHFIVAQAGPRLVALRVDRATELLGISPSAIAPATAVVPGAEYTAGIARLADGLLVIHDLERFLALDEAKRLDSALGGTAEPAPRRKARGSA